MTGIQIAKVAIDACGPRVAVGIGPRFAHIDVRGVSGAWLYKGVPARQLAELKLHRDAKLLARRGRGRRPQKGPSGRRA